ncbi:MAG: hypothetical protein OXC26_02565 [Albidovulum sp.]|nr:hypothetical protein [Albidovulum sp.]
MQLAHVARQAAQAEGKYPGSQVGNLAALRQHHEPTVVGNQMQARELLLGRPADPGIPRADLEGARRPAQKGQPDLAPNRHVPKRLAEQAVERKIVMLPDQRIPAALFTGTAHRANRDLA